MELNFKKLKKEFMRITLPDDRTLTVKPPKYSTVREFSNLDLSSEDDAFKGAAIILNLNMEGVKFTEAECYELFDVTDLVTLMTEFSNYITKITKQKNS